jgi:hypothetical protein
LALAAVMAAGTHTLMDSSLLFVRPDPASPLLPGAVVSVTARASCSGQRTSSGVPARQGVAAATAGLLPLGSVIEVDAAGAPFDGLYTVMHELQRGADPSLAIYVRRCEDAERFGRRDVRLRVMRTGWQPHRSAPTDLP